MFEVDVFSGLAVYVTEFRVLKHSQSCSVVLWSLVSVLTQSQSFTVNLWSLVSVLTQSVFHCESLISRFSADEVPVFHCESLISSFSADAVTVFHCGSLVSRFSADAFTDLQCGHGLCFHVRDEVYQQLLRLWHHPELCRWHRWWYYLQWVDGNGDNGGDVDDDDHWKW